MGEKVSQLYETVGVYLGYAHAQYGKEGIDRGIPRIFEDRIPHSRRPFQSCWAVHCCSCFANSEVSQAICESYMPFLRFTAAHFMSLTSHGDLSCRYCFICTNERWP